jgi:hypothetical protein
MWPDGHCFTLANGHAAILGKKGHTTLQQKKKRKVKCEAHVRLT